MHVLVTGAGGFSGRFLVRQLLESGHAVTALTGSSRSTVATEVASDPQLKTIAGDLSRPLPLPERIDAIVHAGARSPAPGISAYDLVRDNVAATERVVALARRSGARTLIFFSSLSVYGRIHIAEVDERTEIINPGVYGMTKLLGESLVAELAQEGRCRTLAMRLPGLIGRGSARNWLSGIIAAAKSGREIAVCNPRACFNNAVHIEDLSRFTMALLEGAWAGHDIVTLGAHGMTTVREAVEMLIAALGSQSTIRDFDDLTRPSFTISSRRAIERYGYRARAIDEMLLQFAQENRG